jgi:hypothetical protein
MGHISSTGAGIYTTMCLNKVATAAVPGTGLASEWHALFDTGAERTQIANVRDFPAMGTPPNIIKVPGFGNKQSKQVQGQADAPSIELTVNYIPNDWIDGGAGTLGFALSSKTAYAVRFALMNSDPGAAVTGLATENTCFYFIGKIEAVLVKPALSDATTATVTMSMQSDFYGAFTH